MSGYCYCACRDCFEIAIAGDSDEAYCRGCTDAGCPDEPSAPNIECMNEARWAWLDEECDHETEKA